MMVDTHNPAALLQDGESLLTELVRIHSPSGQERRAVMHLVDWLSRHGFAAHRDAAGNAVGVLDGPVNGGPVREIVLLGHIDTVPGFPTPTIRDGKLYGRGAVDAKGPHLRRPPPWLARARAGASWWRARWKRRSLPRAARTT
jgi:acetylornithine deacetylase/succinyl-diaminopimelate desuccinylase-like protein